MLPQALHVALPRTTEGRLAVVSGPVFVGLLGGVFFFANVAPAEGYPSVYSPLEKVERFASAAQPQLRVQAALEVLAAIALNRWLVRAVHDLAYQTGGPVHVVSVGVFLAGSSVAIPRAERTLRWLAALGISAAIVCGLAVTAMFWEPATYLLPITRFLLAAWILGVCWQSRSLEDGDRRHTAEDQAGASTTAG